ncbi:MAG: hypothetical protein ACK47B_09820 [Armatimonadota bacterium]
MSELSLEERDRLLDRMADEVLKRRLEVPAILALELHRPLTFLGSQAVALFTPMLAPAFGLANLEKLYHLLEDRGNLDLLLERIEAGAAERRGEGCSPEPVSAAAAAGKSEP